MNVTVRFIGGPLDGELRDFPGRPPAAWKVSVLTCNPLLAPRPGGPAVPVLAVYELTESIDGGLIYRHTRTWRDER